MEGSDIHIEGCLCGTGTAPHVPPPVEYGKIIIYRRAVEIILQYRQVGDFYRLVRAAEGYDIFYKAIRGGVIVYCGIGLEPLRAKRFQDEAFISG
jgi:hypothetical protein